MLNILVIPYFNNLFSNRWKLFRDQCKFFSLFKNTKTVIFRIKVKKEVINELILNFWIFFFRKAKFSIENLVKIFPYKIDESKTFSAI